MYTNIMFFESCTNTSPVYVNQYKVPKYLLKEVLLTTMHQYIYIYQDRVS